MFGLIGLITNFFHNGKYVIQTAEKNKKTTFRLLIELYGVHFLSNIQWVYRVFCLFGTVKNLQTP